MAGLTGRIYRSQPEILDGTWCQSVASQKRWTRVKFIVPFVLQFVNPPSSIVCTNVTYQDCSDLRIEQIFKNGFECSVFFGGSWGHAGEITFTWTAEVTNEN